jgi:isopentenyl diphosphate isomerase/L-lactate dehydrogenase-like FMN-dependent dehydrogenase
LQIYLWRDRRFVQSLVERAASSGYKALCLTVDSVVAHGRDRDIRNGLNFPPRVTVRDALDVTRHPRWLWGYLRERPVHLKNLDVDFRSRDALAVPQLVKQLKNLTATWDELRWLRRVWDGPIVVKGILTAEAASAAFDHGADGVICSNHGGRELDGVTPSFLALPRVVEEAVARRKEVFLDSGVRRGSDVVKALALGARACLIARPYYWGLAVAGEAGVLQVCDVLRREIESVLGNLGRPTLEGLDASAVEWLPATGPLRP